MCDVPQYLVKEIYAPAGGALPDRVLSWADGEWMRPGGPWTISDRIGRCWLAMLQWALCWLMEKAEK